MYDILYDGRLRVKLTSLSSHFKFSGRENPPPTELVCAICELLPQCCRYKEFCFADELWENQ